MAQRHDYSPKVTSLLSYSAATEAQDLEVRATTSRILGAKMSSLSVFVMCNDGLLAASRHQTPEKAGIHTAIRSVAGNQKE